MPATGRHVEIAAHILMRVDEGKVTEIHGIFDEAGLLRQLGAIS
jgi:predicted ester cyclase